MTSDRKVLLRLRANMQAAEDDARYLAAHRGYMFAAGIEHVLTAGLRLQRHLDDEFGRRVARARRDQEA